MAKVNTYFISDSTGRDSKNKHIFFKHSDHKNVTWDKGPDKHQHNYRQLPSYLTIKTRQIARKTIKEEIAELTKHLNKLTVEIRNVPPKNNKVNILLSST